jgi:hypothetical protein
MSLLLADLLKIDLLATASFLASASSQLPTVTETTMSHSQIHGDFVEFEFGGALGSTKRSERFRPRNGSRKAAQI